MHMVHVDELACGSEAVWNMLVAEVVAEAY